jgi:hypothetical protein
MGLQMDNHSRCAEKKFKQPETVRARTGSVGSALSWVSKATYLEAPALEKNHRTHTVSSDEMTGIQALERTAPTKLMIAGKPARIEFESREGHSSSGPSQ